MSEIIAFENYRSEKITINGESFTVHFSKRKDGEEYALHAVNDDGTKNWRGFYSAETAADFTRSTGQKLGEGVYSVLQDDIDRGNVQ